MDSFRKFGGTLEQLSLIDNLCSVFEESDPSVHEELAPEIFRIIKAVSSNRQVVILLGGIAEGILRKKIPDDSLLWSIVIVEDDSIPT